MQVAHPPTAPGRCLHLWIWAGWVWMVECGGSKFVHLPPRLDRVGSAITAAAMTTLDGVLQLDAVADELVHENFTCDTRDHEDHTFCGIMFDLACETERPVEYIEISSVHVRGALGPMTVWTTPGSFSGKHETEEAWTKVYSETHARSHNELVELRLQSPLRLKPGERLGLYVHSVSPAHLQRAQTDNS